MGVTRVAVLDPWPAAAYRDTFAPTAPAPKTGDAVPPGWEGLYFGFDAAMADLREDGSPARDGVLDSVLADHDLPRRMYAGEDAEYLRPLRFGDQVTQQADVGEVVTKQGSSGTLLFADVVRRYLVDGHLAVESVWHDVFLEAAPDNARPPRPRPAPQGPLDWTEELRLDARQLFRFSALTFNTHRIHYDRDWAREVEGLDDLLVHGPLTRILLLDALRRHRPGLPVGSFSFRAHAPVLVDTAVTVAGADDRVYALSAAGELMASARWT